MEQPRADRLSVFLLVFEGTLFWAGLAFLQGETVISNFMNLTTGSVALAGLAATLRSVMPMIGQFFTGMCIHKIKKQSRLMAIMGFIDRPLFLLMVPLLMLGIQGPWAAAVFLVIYSLFFLMDGAISLFWVELCTRTMPIRQRGEVISLQQTFGGLAGFAAGIALERIMNSSMSFQTQYTVIFVISGLILAVDALVLARLRDVPHASEPERPVPNLITYLKSLMPLFTADRPVRTVLISRAFYGLTLISAPLNMAFGRDMGGLDSRQLALLVFMPVIGQTAAGVLWAQVCKRLGYKAMMLMAECVGILCALMNLVCFALARSGLPVFAPLSVAMILIAVNIPAYTAFTQQIIVLAPERRRADYLVMASLVLAPLSFGTYLAGLVVERFGYLPVYLVMLLGGVLGLALVIARFIRPKTRFVD